MSAADITAELRISGETGGSIAAVVLSPDGLPVSQTEAKAESGSISLTVPSPVPWSAERPALYTLCISLSDSSGEHIETAVQTFGIRSFAIESSLMKPNGKPILEHYG